MPTNNQETFDQQAAWQSLADQLQAMQSGFGQLQDYLQGGNVITSGADPAGYAVAKGGINRYGQYRPDYTLMRDPATGQLHQNFQQTLGPAYGRLSQQAMAQGDTEWAQAQRGLIQSQQAQAVDAARQQSQAAMAQARGGMAMRGGLRSGAAERMALGGARNLMNQQQQLQMAANQANLGVSAQDAATKQRLLGQVGAAEQTIDQANVGRLAQDIQAQNAFQYGLYSEDMQAYAAQQSSAAQAAASCFLAGTPVTLPDGTTKPIEELDVDDVVGLGGQVTMVMKGKSDHYYCHTATGTCVTGSHAVLEKGEWKRVEDADGFSKVEEPCTVYCLGTDKHLLSINGITFADYYETDNFDDLSPEELIAELNEGLKLASCS